MHAQDGCSVNPPRQITPTEGLCATWNERRSRREKNKNREEEEKEEEMKAKRSNETAIKTLRTGIKDKRRFIYACKQNKIRLNRSYVGTTVQFLNDC